MIPLWLGFVFWLIGVLTGAVALIIFRPKYDAFAEVLELLTAKDFQALADWAQAKANALRTPGK